MTFRGNLCFIEGMNGQQHLDSTAQTRLSDDTALADRKKVRAFVSICIETFRQAMCVWAMK